MALVVADAAAQAVEFVGLPEAQLNLAQAAVYLATAPEVEPAVRRHRQGPGRRPRPAPSARCPLHLRDTGYRGAAAWATARATTTLTTTPGVGSTRSTGPPALAGRRYYEPSTHGAERRVAERMAERTVTPRTTRRTP